MPAPDQTPHPASMIAQHMRDGVQDFRQAFALLAEHFPEEQTVIGYFNAGLEHLEAVADRMDLVALDAELEDRISGTDLSGL